MSANLSLKSIATKCALSVLAMAVVAGCASKKKTEDQTQNGNQPVTVENTPMNFDAQGSDSGKISGLQTVNFEYDKSAITKDAKEKINGNVDWMKKNSNVNIQIEGHCDARGSIEYNLSLGERRAKAVKDYMVGMGIPAGRLSIISYGKEKPIATGDTDEAYAKNRRANFLPLAQ